MRSLRIQLILWTILPLTLVLVGLTLMGVHSHRQTMRELAQERDRMLAATYAVRIEELLRQRERVLYNLARRTLSVDELADWQEWFDGGLVVYNAHGRMSARCSSPAATFPAGWLFLPDVAAWQSRLSYLETALTRAPATVPAAPLGAGVNYSPLFRDETLNDMALLLTVPAAAGDCRPGRMGMSMQQGNNVVAGVVSLAGLGLPAMYNITVGKRGVAYLADAMGRVLVASAAFAPQLNCGANVEESARAIDAQSCRTLAGERHSVAYATVAPTGWRVVVEEPWEDLTSPILRYAQTIFSVALLALVAMALAIGFSWRYVMRPLQLLGKQAARVAWGDYEPLAQSVGGVREIQELQWTLQEMATRIQSYQTGMHDYLAAVTRGQETERRRLARELHDETTQALVAQSQRVQLAQRAIAGGDTARVRELLTELRTLTKSTIAEVRRLIQALRPLYLEDLGLIPALETLVKNLNGDMHAEMQVIGTPRRLPRELELTAFRVVQEALSNVGQHARAADVTLTVTFTDTEVTLAVADDGVGFGVPNRPEMLTPEGHFGLMGMRERVLLAGGQLSLHSRLGEGTTVAVVLPIQNAEW